ncbi:MAG: SDR family oxidoreductase [Acidimicrobiia bacterium]|nr:SDR family oxidoreductase [Acidimicrobiia bacterium]
MTAAPVALVTGVSRRRGLGAACADELETGWITPDIEASILTRNLQPRLGTPEDCAHLVAFLCSERGAWINGQVLRSDGGRLH